MKKDGINFLKTQKLLKSVENKRSQSSLMTKYYNYSNINSIATGTSIINSTIVAF